MGEERRCQIISKGVPECKQQKRRRWRLPGPGLWYLVREEGRVVWADSAVPTVGFTKEQGSGVCCGEPTNCLGTQEPHLVAQLKPLFILLPLRHVDLFKKLAPLSAPPSRN